MITEVLHLTKLHMPVFATMNSQKFDFSLSSASYIDTLKITYNTNLLIKETFLIRNFMTDLLSSSYIDTLKLIYSTNLLIKVRNFMTDLAKR